MSLILSATLRRELHWRDARAATPAAASHSLSHCQYARAHTPSRLTGSLTHTVRGDRDPRSWKTIDTPYYANELEVGITFENALM